MSGLGISSIVPSREFPDGFGKVKRSIHPSECLQLLNGKQELTRNRLRLDLSPDVRSTKRKKLPSS